MIDKERISIRKRLTANDVGATGSHQAGVLIPKMFATEFFPALDVAVVNPSAWLTITAVDIGEAYQWRFIYYNTAVLGVGSRNEYRLTHATHFLRQSHARVGDEFELMRLTDLAYAARIIPASPIGNQPRDDGVLVLSSAGAWRSVRLTP